MAQTLYCWRCRMAVPMLDEEEWHEMHRLLTTSKNPELREIASDRFFELTGFRETNINAIWHHRASLYGPPCQQCGKPLRTPEARWCPACGSHTSNGSA